MINDPADPSTHVVSVETSDWYPDGTNTGRVVFTCPVPGCLTVDLQVTPGARVPEFVSLIFAHHNRRSDPPRFHCPRCGRGSSNPGDVENGYCGACHDWTGLPQPVKGQS